MSCNTVLTGQLINTGSRLGDLSLVTLLFVVPVLLTVGVLLLFWRSRLPRWRRLPHTDQEKLQAVELTLKGAALCMLGVLFAPMVLIGLVPLYYGVRQLAAIRLGIMGSGEDQ